MGDPKRCDRFYTCSNKKATLHTCQEGWLFHSFTRTCALPGFVSCGSRPKPHHDTTTIPTTVSTSTTEISTTPETTTIPTTVPTSTRTSPTTTETTTIPTTVPTSPRTSPTTTKTTTIPTTVPTRTTKIPTTVADCATDGYFPVVGDCSRFFICHNGMRYDQRCVDGLVYNPIMEICDWPANVPSCK